MTARIKSYFLLVGFLSVSFQTLLLREYIADYAVNELIFGTIFFIWLAGSAAGSLSGIKYPFNRLYRSGFHLLWIASVLGMFVLKYTPHLINMVPTENPPVHLKIAIAIVGIFPVSFFCGLLFTSGYLAYRGNLAPYRAYLFEVIGFGAGGMLCSLIIYPFISNLSYAAVCIIISAISPAVLSMRGYHRTGLIGAIIGLMLLAPPASKTISDLKWEPFDLLEEFDTPYGRISAIKNEEQHDIYFDNQRIETIPDPIKNETIVHLPALQLDNARNALIIEGNPFALSRELNKYGFGHIDATIIDERILNVYRQFEEKPKTIPSNLNISIQDAIGFLKRDSLKYDLIILAAQSPSEVRFYTKEFFGLISKRLMPDGVFSFSFNGGKTQIMESEAKRINSVLKSMKTVFRQNVVISGNNITFLSSNRDSEIDISPDYYSTRLEAEGIDNRYVNRNYIYDILSPFRQSIFNETLQAYDDVTGINSVERPAAAFYTMFTSEDFFKLPMLRHILSLPDNKLPVSIVSIALLIAVIIIPPFLRFKNPIKDKIMLMVIISSGLSVMVLELAAIYLFQNAYGSVYIWMAMIFALFMISNAVGLIIGKAVVKKSIPASALKLMQAVSALLILFIIIPVMTGIALTGAYIILVLIFSGFIGGALFTAVTETISSIGNSGNPITAYGYELYGSGLGALIGIPLLLPVCGLTCLLLILLLINLFVLAALYIKT